MKRHPIRGLEAVWGLVVALATSCDPSPQTLASFGAQNLTVGHLDAYLLSLPETEREVPPGMDAAQWMENKIRRLALERILESSEEMARLAASPEVNARRRWSRSAALVSALTRQLAQEARPEAAEVAARADELARLHNNEPLLNFQHIYFRLDRAETPRGRDTVRKHAEEVAARALAGADFPALARQHSDSSDAAGGGLVMNARLSDLDEVSRQVLAALKEQEVSPLVETRTGLHVFRLLRRLTPQPATAQQIEAGARNLLLRERVGAARNELLAQLEKRFEVQTAEAPWRIGSWTLDAEALGWLLPDQVEDKDRRRLVEQFLLAEEAIARGLDTPELAEQLARGFRLMLLDRLFNQRRQELDQKIEARRLRPFYDAQPSLFAEPVKVHLELIFVPQGKDSFAGQKRAGAHVRALRAGVSFAALARRVSTGPKADEGGDLGLLDSRTWSRLGPTVSAAIPKLKLGEISDPIYCTGRILGQDPWLLRGGFAILRLRDRVAERPRSFEEAMEDVRRAYASDHRAELDEELQAQILDEVGFKILRLPTLDEFLR